MKILETLGATSRIWQIFIQDSSSTTGAGLINLTSATAGLTAYYHRDTDTTATAISLVTMTVGTFTSSGFKEIDATNMPGWYQLCPPNAVLASGAKSAGLLLKGATNMAPLPIEVQLTAVDLTDAVAFGLSRLDAAVTSRMATYTQPTGFLAATFPSGTVANTTNITAGIITTVTTVTNQLTAAQIATGVWQDTTAGDFTTASSIGKSLYTTGNAPGAASGLALVGSNVGTASSVTGAVGSVTGNVGGNVTGSVGSVVGAVGSVTGAVGSVTGNVGGNVTGSVGSIASGGITDASYAAGTGKKVIRASTAQAGGATSITLDASASATDTIYVNCLIYLTGGTGAGQARFITAYNGTTKVATVTAWQTNPDATSTFAILPFDAIPGATAPTAAQVATAVWTDLLAGSDFSTVSSVGKLLKDDVDAAVSTRMATYTQPTGFLTATFPTTVASTTNITAAAGVALTAAYDAAKTAAQAGDSMKISVGTGAGQINVSSGIVPANVKQINGTTVNGDGSLTPWGP